MGVEPLACDGIVLAPCGELDGARQIVKYQRTKRRRIGPWHGDESPENTASRTRYLGSQEHKAYPSPAGPPALRSGATPCDPKIEWDDINAVLREAIRRCCTGKHFEQGFPKYVWGWLDGDLYEARHINGPAGTYKGYRLEEAEYPRDPEKLLDWSADT